MKAFILQKHYGRIEIDSSEKDIIQIWMEQKDDSQVIQIEKENIPVLIEMLKQLNK